MPGRRLILRALLLLVLAMAMPAGGASADYADRRAALIEEVRMFLQGRSRHLVERLPVGVVARSATETLIGVAG